MRQLIIMLSVMDEDQLEKVLDRKLAQFFGQVTKYVDGRIGEVNARLDRHEQRFDHIDSVLDSILKQLETHEQERLALGAQVDRHEGWIRQLAGHAKVELSEG